MAENTAIEWTDATFNPWWGCQKVSPACDHCYAERDAHRFAPDRVLWGVGAERRTFGDAHWQQPMKWAKQTFVECAACGWRVERRAFKAPEGIFCQTCRSPSFRQARRRVFCASMADWLDLDAPLDQFVRLLDTIRRTPELDWLLLSKRIGNWRKRLEAAIDQVLAADGAEELLEWIYGWRDGTPPAHVWLGATVVTQEEANRDVPKLLLTPARVRFLSIEPMLGPINVTRIEIGDHSSCLGTWCAPLTGTYTDSPLIHWVICGGESGPQARPMHPDWARSLKQQCQAAGVPFFMKQMTKKTEIPADLLVREFPHAA